MFTTPYVVYLLLIIENYFTRFTDMLSGNAAASRRSIIVILHVSWFVIGERERANVVVQLARFFYIFLYGRCTYRIFLNVST